MCVCNLCYPATRRTFSALYYIAVHGLSGATVFFPHNLINGTNFGKIFVENKMCSEFLLSATFLILRRIQRNITINVHSSLCEILTVLIILKISLDCFWHISTSFQIQNSRIFAQWEPTFSRRTEEGTDGNTESTKIIPSFRSPLNVSKDRYNEYVGTKNWPRYVGVLFTCRHQ